ncbi:hypothetical protein G5B40_04750 [Pikeienuella piscinae]|uniref:VPLPA-CTERM sorting domain-containing protein n=1 Tax=Pikeienuella piscinae TaxID=2748098 RepID=A0A7L5BY41_9RHOB|nr:hypothetical protein [Pikeienuella piscinae]QIE54814.1 hypothetical protein G5B40_04750 [Pikeienuella piscinae]
MKSMLVMTAAALAIAAPRAGDAATFAYTADLVALNSSGVTGMAELLLDDVAMTLDVQVSAKGLEANQLHVQHIHGLFDANGNPANSQSPTIAQDADGDGFVELLEGATSYGPIVLELRDDTIPGTGGFPMAPHGTIDFSYQYDLLTTPAFAAGMSAADLFDLTLREIVIHGMSVRADQGVGTGGEVNGTAGYRAVLPVATGEFELSAVPVPAALPLFLTAIGLMGFTAYRRKVA